MAFSDESVIYIVLKPKFFKCRFCATRNKANLSSFLGAQRKTFVENS